MSEKAARMCGGKKRHNSQRRADEAARHTQKVTGVPMKGYECDFCHGFHVGSVEQHDPQHHAKPRRERFMATEVADLEYVANRRRKSTAGGYSDPLVVTAPPVPSVVLADAPPPQPLPPAGCPLPVIPLGRELLNQHEFVDLTGHILGHLTVIGWGGNGRWIVRCSCGSFDYRRTATLRRTRAEGDMPQQCNECNKRGFRASLPEYTPHRERI